KELIQESCEAAKLLKTLAHPVRLQILCHLADGKKNVGELVGCCGSSQSLMSQFLGRMKLEGIIDAERDGQFTSYFIVDARTKELLKTLCRLFC
ncbi:MAG: winged helix-turn-helix transcriptional regulator, partial [Deltaproteobacteria bacterium]|nr:winged helix-turn-helix transcriptional regulator [Deltaproteobacteria bacterium]